MNKCKYIEYKYLIEKTTTHKKTNVKSYTKYAWIVKGLCTVYFNPVSQMLIKEGALICSYVSEHNLGVIDKEG